MQEVIIATFLFWSAFVFSAGPFWIATMEAAPNTTFRELYADYALYLIFGWLPVSVITSLASGVLQNSNPMVFIAMHLLGGIFIIYMGYKVLYAKISKGAAFNFKWRNMCVITYLNPKVYILLPVGFIAAQLTDNLAINIAFFYFSGIPLFLFGVWFWGMIGRAGARVSFQYISYFNAALLATFGLYLVYEGIKLTNNLPAL